MFKFNNMKNIYLFYFIIAILILFSFTFNIEISHSQSNKMGTESESSITSYLDALFKAPLLISQAFVVGVSFIHSFLFIIMIKTEHIFFNNNNKNNHNFFLSLLFDNKLFLIIIIVSGALILSMSTILIVFQAYILSFDLDFNLLSTFTILLSSSVGNVFIIKLIASIFIIALSISHYYISKRFRNQLLPIIEENKSYQELQEQNYIKEKLKNQKISLIFCITILIFGSINLFSNSIQSHNAAVNLFPNLAISADWLHFIMVSIWLGGLFYISLIISQLFIKENLLVNHHHHHNHNQIKPSIKYSKDLVIIQFILLTILRFSFIAVISLSVIFITGLYMAVLHLQQPISLINSIYGNILILKLFLVFSMAFLGGYHHLQIPKLINKKNEKSQLNQVLYLKKFNKTLKIEYILGISIIFISSFLTITDPPHHQSHNMDTPTKNHYEDTITQHTTNIDNQRNNLFNKAFPLIAFTISILIIILMILFLKRSWTNLKLYKNEKLI
jgi:copper transport protein